MALVREAALKTITDNLSWLAMECKLRGLLHLFDSNTILHELFCRLLNEVYDLALVPTDRIKANYPSIDLGDEVNKRCFQITTEKDGAKVQKTLDTFVQHRLAAQYGRLQILIIGDKQRSYKSVEVPAGLTFNPDTDILDLKDCFKYLDTLPTDKLVRVAQVVAEEIKPAPLAEAGMSGKQHTDDGRPKLAAGYVEPESDPEGWATQFRLRVQNTHEQRTIENVCVRVTSLVSIEGNDRHQRITFARPLLAISGTGLMPSNPPETVRSLVAGDSAYFDVVWVHSHRKAGHSLCYGECVKDRPFLRQENERWKFAPDRFLDPGRYEVTIEVQGRDVVPIRKQYVFWGDKTGQHCVESSDPCAQSTEALEIAPIDLDTLPPEMHPHQLRALEAELINPCYSDMTLEEAYRRIDRDKTMCGLSAVRYVSAAIAATIPDDRWHRTIVISDEEAAGFPPGGIPGFPNAIRRSDFEIAWQTVKERKLKDAEAEPGAAPNPTI